MLHPPFFFVEVDVIAMECEDLGLSNTAENRANSVKKSILAIYHETILLHSKSFFANEKADAFGDNEIISNLIAFKRTFGLPISSELDSECGFDSLKKSAYFHLKFTKIALLKLGIVIPDQLLKSSRTLFYTYSILLREFCSAPYMVIGKEKPYEYIIRSLMYYFFPNITDQLTPTVFGQKKDFRSSSITRLNQIHGSGFVTYVPLKDVKVYTAAISEMPECGLVFVHDYITASRIPAMFDAALTFKDKQTNLQSFHELVQHNKALING